MAALLKRLVSSLGAYQLADVVSKVIAIVLLPVYTGYLDSSQYGIVETLATFVIFVSIVVRFGIIEAFLRFHFTDRDRARQDALARRSILFLLATSTLGAVLLMGFAAPLARLVTTTSDTTDFRVAVVGLWSFTNLELAYALLRVDERLRAYATASLINVGLTVAASLVLVVGFGLRAEGLLIGNYGATTLVLFGLWWAERGRFRASETSNGIAKQFHALFEFGLPTVPAEASVYALSVLDRQFIVHDHGLGRAGQYSIALKLAGAIAFLVRAFQYAWPPLAYSIDDDAQAGRFYAFVTTLYALIAGWAVAGLTLESRWIIRVLAPHTGYLGAYRAVPWVSLGWALYGLWVVFLVIAGRARVTRRNFPAALAGVVVNVVLLIALVPPLGIAGAGIALCGAYLGMLVVMHLLVRRAFAVEFEWRRLAHIAVVMGAAAALGDLFLPTHGFVGFVTRLAVFAAIPAVLLVTRFPRRQEVEWLRHSIGRSLRERPAGSKA